MNEKELGELISKTAVLMEQYQRMCAQMEQQQKQMAAVLEGLAQEIPAMLGDSVQSALQPLASDASQSVRSALQEPLKQHEHQMGRATRELSGSAQSLADELQLYRWMSRGVLWKAAATVVASLGILVAGAAWLGGHYRQQISQNQLEAELLQAYNRADVVLCGKGRLCANVDTRGRGFGTEGQYREVRPRP